MENTVFRQISHGLTVSPFLCCWAHSREEEFAEHQYSGHAAAVVWHKRIYWAFMARSWPGAWHAVRSPGDYRNRS